MNRSGFFGVVLSVLAISLGVTSCRPDFDLDKRMPEWLGTSIYETLKNGITNDSTGAKYTFNTFVKLIEDLDQVDVLAKTGSKTMFVADDAAFERFFQDCPFYDANGNKITSYEQMSKAQKTLILNGSMLNNVYQVAMLSSSPGGEQAPPVLGNCMRRVSASNVLDSVPVVLPAQMPQRNKYWEALRANEKGAVILQDGTPKPIIFFVNKFLQSNKITAKDYQFLFRLEDYTPTGVARRKYTPGDASVNGVTIDWPNKKCFNGFLHVMSEVVYQLPNMAEYIATNPKSKIYSSILDRFSVPDYERSHLTDRDEQVAFLVEHNRVGNNVKEAMAAHGDSVFIKKYLSRRAKSGSGNNAIQNQNYKRLQAGNKELLKFDPGWNSFTSSTLGNDQNVNLQKDMGLMFVPYDEYLMNWWLNPTEGGSKLRDRYGLARFKGMTDLPVDSVIVDMSGIPLDVIVELVNNNMQSSLVGSVPSKFPSVLNDAQDPFFGKMSIDDAMATIDDVVMCCNGAVYFTNTIYTPTTYKSVSYPVIVNEKLKIIDWAIREDEQLAYKAYLNSTVATYSFFVPLIDTVGAPLPEFKDKLVWIDPASYYLEKEAGDGKYRALAFSYGRLDPDNLQEKEKVICDVFIFDKNTGEFTPTTIQLVPGTDSQGNENNATKFIRNRIMDLMDYHIVIGDVQTASVKDGDYSYFRTKGRGVIRFKNDADWHNMEVQGGWQIENEGEPDEIQRPVKIVDYVDLSQESASKGNGHTYILDRPLMPSRKSVYDIISDSINYPEFKSFFNLMWQSGLFTDKSNTNEIGSFRNVSTFNTYHYTVYVPKNEGIDALLANKTIMLPEELNSLVVLYDTIKQNILADYDGEANVKDSITTLTYRDSLVALSVQLFGVADSAGALIAATPQKPGETDAAYNARRGARYFTSKKLEQLRNFVKYHIQDNSVYVGADFNPGVGDDGQVAEKAEYETAFMNSNQQFVKLKVKGGADVDIFDKADHNRKVLKIKSATDKPYYNIMCREYEVKPISTNGTLSEGTYEDFSLETSSFAVVHLIDQPLCNGEVIF